MLTPGRLLVAVVMAAGAAAVAAGPALAAMPDAGPVQCPPEQTVCTVQAQSSGRPEASRSAGSPATSVSRPPCRIPASPPGGWSQVDCLTSQFGAWNNTDGCYYQEQVPQPPPTDPAWEGHYPNGAVYNKVCLSLVPGLGAGWVWLPMPPATPAAPAVTPAVLAQRAVQQLTLQGPQIGMAPPAGAIGLVRVPVWLWTAVTPSTWGPQSATAAVPGLSVTATARASKIVWGMGDGQAVTCTGPGTPYRPDLGTVTSPTCGHVYAQSSVGRPGDAYPVTAITTWQITWAGGGQAGALTVTRTARTTVRIGEMQVLT